VFLSFARRIRYAFSADGVRFPALPAMFIVQ
jgi:hypothetical protein